MIWSALFPWLRSSTTRERAIALEIRGFEAGQKKTYLREGKMKTSDRMLCLVMAVVIAGAIVVRIVF